MPEPLQIHIYDKSGREYGPFHWKHVVEWHELSLLDDFTWKASSGRDRPVKELIRTLGVPPSIMTRSIFLAPPEDAPDAPPEAMAALHAAGFPEAIGAIPEETLNHITKRLALSDAALDAEDADFKAGDPYEGKEVPGTNAKRPPAVENETIVESTPKAATSGDDAGEDAAAAAAADPLVSVLLEGDAVDPAEPIKSGEPLQKKARSERLPVAIALVLFFGVGAGLFFFLRGDSSSVEVAVPDAKVLAEPTPEEVSVPVKSETLVEETVSAPEIITSTADPVIEEDLTFVEETDVSEEVAEEVAAEEAVIAEAVADVAESLPIRVASDAADAEAPTPEVDALAQEEGPEDVAQAAEDSATAPIPIPIPVPILAAEVKTAEAPQEASATQPADRDSAETEAVDDPPEDPPVVTTPTQVAEPVEPRSEALPQTSDDVPAPAPESDRTNRRQRIIEEFPDYIPSF